MDIENRIEIDIIILSYAHNDSLLQITTNCIGSLLASENSSQIKFNVVVLESNTAMKPYQYLNTKTVYPDVPFGYHRYMNIGIELTTSPYICMCNNDLIFHKQWASEILKYMLKFPGLASFSPICSRYHPYIGTPLNNEVILGYRVGYEIAGWCIFTKREILKKIGRLDENYKFSGADYDYSYILWVCNLKHALIPSSIVDHLTAQTLETQTQEKQDELTKQVTYHLKKWSYRIGLGTPID